MRFDKYCLIFPSQLTPRWTVDGHHRDTTHHLRSKYVVWMCASLILFLFTLVMTGALARWVVVGDEHPAHWLFHRRDCASVNTALSRRPNAGHADKSAKLPRLPALDAMAEHARPMCALQHPPLLHLLRHRIAQRDEAPAVFRNRVWLCRCVVCASFCLSSSMHVGTRIVHAA